MAFAGLHGTLSLWDVVARKELWTLKAHAGWIEQVTFNPDGKLLATAATDGAARVWDVATGMNLLTLPVDSSGAGGVSFNPDGTRLAVGGGSGISIFLLPV